ncbi:MAG: ABC transporter permease [Chloroflexi bacterium]|nr:ABC transporter permease [Chloroflexota bacterium]
MDELRGAYTYFLDNQSAFGEALVEHLRLSLTALAIALLICVPLGVWAAKRRVVAQSVINIANALRVVPSLAVLFLALPYLGIGFRPSLIALTVLACPPILINTYAGFRSVDRAVIEAAYGMGMAAPQVLRAVEFPLALPVLVAGVRIATIEVIASASLAAYIAGGGLGEFIQRGFAVNNLGITLAGTIPIALLALLADALLAGVQRAASVSAR